MKLTINQQFQTFLTQIGVNTTDILEKAQLPDVLWQNELTLNDSQYYQFLETLSAELTDDQLIAVSDVTQMSTFMPPFFAAMCATDGLAAIKRLATYKQLIGPIKFDVTENAKSVSITIHYLSSERTLPRFALLNEQLILLSIVRTGSGQPITPMRVTGPYTYGATIDQNLGITGQQSTSNQIEFDRQDLATPFLTKNNTMWQYLEPEFTRQLDQLTQKRPNSMTTEMHKLLYRQISANDYGIKTIADGLGVSVRTLQRHLTAEKTTFKIELQRIQKQLALSLADNPELNTTEIAYLVGYSETSAFTRAFKKWTGQTLRQYQASHR